MTDFDHLAPEYDRLAAAASILPGRERQIEASCARLLEHRDLYAEVEDRTGVPAAALMALSEREMAGNVACYLGNGQSLRMRTTIVPVGRGPFPDFVSGALDALHLDGLDGVHAMPGGWSLARFCYESEAWNGWGYRARGLPSPYVFGATTVQRPGKFVRDHVFDAHQMDPQIGTLAIAEELTKLDPSLKFFDPSEKVAAIIGPVAPHPVIAHIDVARVQHMLNLLRVSPNVLAVDGNCGRGTRVVIALYQSTHHLVVDGLPGPQTYASLLQSMAEVGL